MKYVKLLAVRLCSNLKIHLAEFLFLKVFLNLPSESVNSLSLSFFNFLVLQCAHFFNENVCLFFES